VEPFIPVHYNGLLEASIQDYIKCSVGPFIPVHYNRLIEAYMKGYNKGSGRYSFVSIIMDN
jgi:hypothetical protein